MLSTPPTTDTSDLTELPLSSADLYRPIAICAALLFLSAVVFYAFPSIDIAASSWFYSANGGFYLGKTTNIVAIRNVGIWITTATIVGLIGLGIWWQMRPTVLHRWHSSTPRADWLFVAAGMLLGPGLLVNLLFKPIWGRARPIHIEQFGGKEHFTPAWAFSNQCSWGCSFVSGEAAASAFILAFAFVVPTRWRAPVLAIGVAVTLAVSFARMAAGGHFLSDVVTGWLLIILLILILRAQIYHGALLGPLARWHPNPRKP